MFYDLCNELIAVSSLYRDLFLSLTLPFSYWTYVHAHNPHQPYGIHPYNLHVQNRVLTMCVLRIYIVIVVVVVVGPPIVHFRNGIRKTGKKDLSLSLTHNLAYITLQLIDPFISPKIKWRCRCVKLVIQMKAKLCNYPITIHDQNDVLFHTFTHSLTRSFILDALTTTSTKKKM